MISKKMQEALNKQLNKELFSSYLYLSMSAYLEESNYTGMAVWMRQQADEEHEHAMKFFEFLLRVNSKVILEQIDKPQTEWKSPEEVFKASLEHEKFISKSIFEIVDLAYQEKDHATRTFLNWFVDEQVEEEASVNDIVQKFEMIGDSKGALYMLDRELGKRGEVAH
ncbi:MAG: ferritin [Ignavibacteria bacterium]|jgi:ferritin